MAGYNQKCEIDPNISIIIFVFLSRW